VISISGLLGQAFAILLALVLAPLLSGWVGQCRAWLQSRTAPPLLLPYYQLQKLFHKDVVLAHGASSLFRAAPFVVFGCMVLACAIIPSLSTDLPLAPAADALALVGVFGLARIFISLAAMDVGTSFGSLGGRREMLVGFLAEPALLMVIFTLAMIAQSTSRRHHRRDPGASRTGDLSQPGLRRHRLHLRFASPKTRACRWTTRRPISN
jgi:formate hydrogenlyase subunit 4